MDIVIFIGILTIAFCFQFFGFGILVLIIAKLMHKERVVDITTCCWLWVIFPFILPHKAKKKGLISKQIYSWILVLVSPAFILLYVGLWLGSTATDTLSYEELLFTSREEIAAITEIENFPEFEYVDNFRDNWDGATNIEYRFTDSTQVNNLFKEIKLKLKDKENIFWSNGGICERGWDTQYTKSPQGFKNDSTAYQVKVDIDMESFTITYKRCYAWDLEYYSNRDSLSALTEVDFPKYEIIDLSYNGDGIDSYWNAKLKLDKKPSTAFIQSLRKSEDWEKMDDGRYSFFFLNREGQGDLMETIIVDPKSRIVELSVCTH